MGETPVDQTAVEHCEQMTREWIASVKNAEACGYGLIEILPAVLAVLREEGFNLDPSQLPMLGQIGGMI